MTNIEMRNTFLTAKAMFLFVLTQCLAEVAIVVPYRDRPLHLDGLLTRWNLFLESENVHIFLAEQNDTAEFNRGRMRNIGFVEAANYSTQNNITFTHVVFEDVDTWPRTAKGMELLLLPPLTGHIFHLYAHLSSLGGAWTVNINDYQNSNGFPNDFVGWGAEDEVMKERMMSLNITIHVHCHMDDLKNKNCQDIEVLNHERNKSSHKRNLAKRSQWRSNRTGLSDLDYTVTQSTSEKHGRLWLHHIWAVSE